MKRYNKSSAEWIDYPDYDEDLGELMEVSDNGQYCLYKKLGWNTKKPIYHILNDLDDNQYRWTVYMEIINTTHTVTVNVVEVNPSSPIDKSIFYFRKSLSEAYDFKRLIEKTLFTDTPTIER